MNSVCLFKVSNNSNYKKVTFEITSKCNLFCKHCCTNSDFNGNFKLKKEDIEYFLNDLKNNGVSDLYITGGEPFLYPYIEYFLKMVYRIGFKTSIATNATLLNDNHINLLKKVINKSVLVSIDGFDEDSHNRIRGIKFAWNKTVENIKNMTKKGIKVKISSIIWKENIDNLEKMIKNAINWGVNEIYFVWPLKTGRLLNNKELLSDNNYLETFTFLEKMKLKYKNNINLTFKRRKNIDNHTLGCLGGQRLFHINSDLEIYPCSWISKIGVKNNFRTVWSIDNDFKKCIKQLHNFIDLVKIREKKYNNGCPAIAFIETGDIFGKDPLLNK